MPHTPAEDLQVGAGNDDVQTAMNQCVTQLVDEGRDREQAVAICQDQLRKSTGRPL